jgi:predicted alpha-1,2-mannosidase
MRSGILIVLISFIQYTSIIGQTIDNPSQYVNPLIGTKGGGHTFPGSPVPYGMVKLGPDCGNMRSNSGYIPDEEIHGFSHTHVSGTGGGAKYGNILVMPFTGDLDISNSHSASSKVKASPGYFAVNLDKYKINAELTSSHSVGFHQYTFPTEKGNGILINAGSFLGEGHCCDEAQNLIGSEISIISNTEIEGYSRVRGGWGKGGEYTVYFYANFSTPADDYGIWKGEKITESANLAYDSGEKTGAYFLFDKVKGATIKVKVGISFISTGKAKENMNKEIPHWNFKQTHNEAITQWNEVLNTIKIETESNDWKTIFYTALYHTMLMPVDRTGENPKWTSNEPYYDDYYAIWDTYRATTPLLTLIQPRREADIVKSLIDIYQHEGYMPDARAGNQTGRTQGGSNCDMVIADAYLKGLKGIDFNKAYEAIITNAEIAPGGNQQFEGRGGINEYIELGYVPAEYEPENEHPNLHTPKLYDRAGTRTVEYAANDWAIALVAKGMGKMDDYYKYKSRASNWANLWRQVGSEAVNGFIWPKTKTGKWVEDFSVTKGGSWGNFFYEANSWEYSFYVPQDVKSLIDSCGGTASFIKRLDTFFINKYFQVSNEPSFFTPCLYAYAGRQDLTNTTVRNIIKNHYYATENGIPGNDDAGSMSAWLVFNSIGFFPNAGQDVYIFTSPHFKRVKIDMGEGIFLNVIAHELSEENIYIREVKINGESIDRSWFSHGEIKNGGTIELFMSNQISGFGTKNLPPSIADYE